jgi:hypothetical protein
MSLSGVQGVAILREFVGHNCRCGYLRDKAIINLNLTVGDAVADLSGRSMTAVETES